MCSTHTLHMYIALDCHNYEEENNFHKFIRYKYTVHGDKRGIQINIGLTVSDSSDTALYIGVARQRGQTLLRHDYSNGDAKADV